MKVVIQRVKRGKVSVQGETVGEIHQGLFMLVGVGKIDDSKKAEVLAQKIAKMRLMRDGEDKMNKSVADIGGSLLVVSQFTLFADTSGGNRPSFLNAAPPELARSVYEAFISQLRNLGLSVETGKFGEYMEIDVLLDGPVTIILES